MTMVEAYEEYFGTGHYTHRYPNPNSVTLSRARDLLSTQREAPFVVDIGAGNGRYALSLAAVGANVLAIERSSAARSELVGRIEAAGLGARVSCFSDLADVPGEWLRKSALVLLAFGVLGHMTDKERGETLLSLARELRPGTALAGSVPNRLRRFRLEQRADRVPGQLEFGKRFRYQRMIDHKSCTFEYTAYSPQELRCELIRYGWRPIRIGTESILSEERTVSNHAFQTLNQLARMVPALLSYCIYYEAILRAPNHAHLEM